MYPLKWHAWIYKNIYNNKKQFATFPSFVFVTPQSYVVGYSLASGGSSCTSAHLHRIIGVTPWLIQLCDYFDSYIKNPFKGQDQGINPYKVFNI